MFPRWIIGGLITLELVLLFKWMFSLAFLSSITETRGNLAVSRCQFILAPGRTHSNKDGHFAYISSFAWIPTTQTLHIVSLGTNFFLANRDFRLKKSLAPDLALNQSFPFLDLRSPVDLVPSATWGILRANCTLVRSVKKDITLFNKVNIMTCTFVGLAQTSQIVQLRGSSLCWNVDISKSQGRIAEYTSRRHITPRNEISLVICVAGVRDFTPFAKELVLSQLVIDAVSHFYIGLNSNSVQLRQQYLDAFQNMSSKVSIVPSPAPDADVLFTQGKLPILNECLIQAKLHQDTLLGIWDLDEKLVMKNAIQVWESIPLESTCFLNVNSVSCMEGSDNHSLSLADRFPFSPQTNLCGNYSKSISVVSNVGLMGIHLPEACDLYPVQLFSVRRSPFFIQTSPLLKLAHYTQLFQKRYTKKCKLLLEKSDLCTATT